MVHRVKRKQVCLSTDSRVLPWTLDEGAFAFRGRGGDGKRQES